MTTGIGIVVRTAVHVRVHNRHTIYDMRVNEEIYLNIIRSKKQQQSNCRYPCDSMFFTFHAAKVQRIFGTAKFLVKKNLKIVPFSKICTSFFAYLSRFLVSTYFRIRLRLFANDAPTLHHEGEVLAAIKSDDIRILTGLQRALSVIDSHNLGRRF